MIFFRGNNEVCRTENKKRWNGRVENFDEDKIEERVNSKTEDREK